MRLLRAERTRPTRVGVGDDHRAHVLGEQAMELERERAAPGQAEEVRSHKAGLVEQGEEAAGVVLHREIFGRVTGLSASRSIPRYDVEVTAEIVDLCPPEATVGYESVQEEERRPGSA